MAAFHIAEGDEVFLGAALVVGLRAIQPPEPMKATLSLLLADLPGLPMANRENAVLAATPVAALRKVLRFMEGPCAR